MIYLTSEECDALPFADIDPSDGSGQSSMSQTPSCCINNELISPIKLEGTLEVLNNRTFGQALQINGLVGQKEWSKFTSNLIIENNEARGFSTHINMPSKDTYSDALQNRLELANIITAAGAGGSMWQPPPYPPYRQMGYYQAPPPMPGTQWHGQQQNPWAHPYPAAMQGGAKLEDILRTLGAPQGQEPLLPDYEMYPVSPSGVDPSSHQVNPSTKMDTAG